MLITIAFLGYGCSTIYGSSISLGTLILKNPSPRLVSFFIAASGVGTYAGEFYSSYILTFFGSSAIVVCSGILMIFLFIIILYVSVTEKIKRAKAFGVTPTN